ncbi:MAG TPA: hypothetical protein VF066_12350 [Thermoleophilaceae bacterium]
MHADSLEANPPIVGDRYVDGIEPALVDAPEICGALVREDGTVTAREDRSHEAAVTAKWQFTQLFPRDHVMPAPNERPNRLMVDRAAYDRLK